MKFKLARCKGTALLLILSVPVGCAGPQFQEQVSNTPVVPVKAVIDTLKCGLSNAVGLDTLDRSGLRSATAAVTLDVNVIAGSNVGGSISAGIPVSNGAGTFSPSFSASQDTTLTNNTTTEFDVTIAGGDGSACRAIAGKYQDAGFSLWLAQSVFDINLAVAGPPYASMKRYAYDSNFILKKSAKGGFEFEIVPVKLGATFDTSRSDVQHINIVIKAVSVHKGKRVDHGREFQIGPKRGV